MISFGKRAIYSTYVETRLKPVLKVLDNNSIKYKVGSISVDRLSLISNYGPLDKGLAPDYDAPSDEDIKEVYRYTVYVSIFDYKKAKKLLEDKLRILIR